jgi:CBS domain containing-hemolysin-like protein
VLSLLGRLAVPGDEVVSEDHRLTLRVLSILGRRIKKVRVTRVEPDEAAEAG